MSGWADFPLSARGRDQVRQLTARLMNGAPLEAVYSSPLQRALQTARPLPAAAPHFVETCAELREINCGEVDGMAIELVKRRYGALWAANLRQDDDHFRWPGGESYAELRARSLSAVTQLARRHAGHRLALVTHAGVISQVVGFLRGEPPARWQDHRPENTSLTELVYREGSLSLESFDDHRHLIGREGVLAGRTS